MGCCGSGGFRRKVTTQPNSNQPKIVPSHTMKINAVAQEAHKPLRHSNQGFSAIALGKIKNATRRIMG